MLPMTPIVDILLFRSGGTHAERPPSAAAGSGSEVRADAGGSQLQGVVRRNPWNRAALTHLPPDGVVSQEQQFPVKSLRQLCWTNGTLERYPCHCL